MRDKLEELLANIGYSTIVVLTALCVFYIGGYDIVRGPLSAHAQIAPASIPQSPKITNLTLTLADTEYSWIVPASVRKIRVNGRGSVAVVKMAWASGESGTNYTEIQGNTSYCQGGILLSSGADTDTLYFQSETAGAVVEIEIWR